MIKEIIKNTEDHMKKSIDSLRESLLTMKAGRANPSMLDRVEVEYYGENIKISALANVSVPEPRMLLIQPFDKTSIKNIEKAIMVSDLGLNPSNDGTSIRVIIPELTEETRLKLVKSIKKIGEETKVAVRNIRRSNLEKLKELIKNGHMSENEVFRGEDQVSKLAEKYTKEVDSIISDKEKQVLSI